jgi:hypothetical protein
MYFTVLQFGLLALLRDPLLYRHDVSRHERDVSLVWVLLILVSLLSERVPQVLKRGCIPSWLKLPVIVNVHTFLGQSRILMRTSLTSGSLGV